MISPPPERISVPEGADLSSRSTCIWELVRAEYPQLCKGVDDDVALTRVTQAIEDGEALDIVEDLDVVRLAALAFLPEAALSDPFISSVLIRILNNFDWNAAKRLDFIYRHLVPRASLFD